MSCGTLRLVTRMKYDDISWHYGGEFPADLPRSAAGIHIGMFVTWATLAGLGGELHAFEFPDFVKQLKDRTILPGVFLETVCDGKLTSEDLSSEGNAFARAYFDSDENRYINDYVIALADNLPTVYHVEDSWESFDLIAPLIKQRLEEWQKQRA